MNMKNRLVLAAITMLMGLSGHAATSHVDLGIQSPPSALGACAVTAFSQAPQAAIREGASVEKIPGHPGGAGLIVSPGMAKKTVGQSWGLWSHGFTGVVYSTDQTTATINLPPGTRCFYFYIEPDHQDQFYPITVTPSGGTSETRFVSGAVGARGFGYHTSGADIASIAIVVDPLASGFAIGEFGVGSVVTVPGMPTAVSASAGFASAQVSFAAPASNGGLPILSYSARCTSSDGGVAGSASELASPVTVTGLSNGKSYSCTVAAANAAGAGPDSASSGAVVPQATVIAPGAPEDVSAGVGNQEASVSFSAPASDGGAAIMAYTVTSSPGGVTASGAASPLTLTGLINGVAYTFSVTATNNVGTGVASAPSNAVTPRTVPGMPTAVSARAGSASAQVSFAAPTSSHGFLMLLGLVLGLISKQRLKNSAR
jgi:Fibronectin type III domain